MVKKAAAKKSTKKSSSVKVNFKGVEVRKTPAEDDYLVKVAEVSKEEGDKAEYLRWVFEISKGADTGKKYKGQKLYYNTSLSENSLWNLRGLLEAMGEEVPEGVMNLDLSEYEGKALGVTAEHDTYEGKARAAIVDYFPEEDFGKSKKDDDDEDDDEGGDDDSDEDADEDESSDNEESEDDNEEDAEEEVSEDDILKMDEDELSELVESAEIDVDLSDFKTIKKKRQAVIDALAAAQEDGDEEEEEESEEEEDDNEEEEDSEEEEDEDEEEEEEEDGELSEDAINKMGTKELQALLKEHKVKCNLSGTTKAKRRAVIKAMKAAKKL